MTLALAGARQLAALLPLLALGALRFFPGIGSGTLLPWVEPIVLGTAAVLAGSALLLAVGDGLGTGRARTVADATGLGMVSVTLAVVALNDSTLPAAAGAVAAGLSAAGILFMAGSFLGDTSTSGRGSRIAAGVAGFVVIEACLGLVLLAAGLSLDERIRPLPLLGAAVLLGIAAVTTADAPTRAVALGIAASAALAQALAAPGVETLIGPAGVGAAATILGASAAARLWRARGSAEPQRAVLPAPPIGVLESRADAEYSEVARLAREVRATIEELITTRRTVELQRAEIERASAVDPLTGVGSRGAILERLRFETAEARRYEHPVAVVVLDVDGFAALNHEHGVAAGDTILREVALRLRLRVREADALGRIGADAFLAVLPHTDERGAVGFADAVRQRLADRPILTDAGEMPVTVSIGIALMRPGTTLSEDGLLASAEEALASARAAGGNRIAFDRDHGLARLDEHRGPDKQPPNEAADGTR